MPVNKVIYGSNVLLDLTEDTVTPDNLLKGATAHRADGTVISGQMVSGTASGILVKIINVGTEFIDTKHVMLDISDRTDIYSDITADRLIVEFTHMGAYGTGLLLGGKVKADLSLSYDAQTGHITITASDGMFDNTLSCVADVYITELPASVIKTPQTKTVSPGITAQTVVPDSGHELENVTLQPVTAELLAGLDGDFKASNIKEGVEMFGLTGTLAAGGGISISPFANIVTGQITPPADTGVFPIDTSKGTPKSIIFLLSDMHGKDKSGDAIVAFIWAMDVNGYENRQMRFYGNLGGLLNSSSSGRYHNAQLDFEKILKGGWTYDYCILYG